MLSIPDIKNSRKGGRLTSNHIKSTVKKNTVMSQNNSFSSAYNIKNIRKYAKLGKSNMNWYSDTHQAFVELLPEYDIELFVKIFAVTSPLSHLESNLIAALQTYKEYVADMPIKEMKLLPNVKVMLQAVKDGTFDPSAARIVARRKVLRFTSAIMGDTQSFPVDSWMCRVLNLDRSYVWNGKTFYRLPTLKQSNEIEDLMFIIAQQLDWEPRQLMAATWAGVRMEEGKFKKTDTRELLLRALLKM